MPPPASATDSPVSPAALEKLATSVAEAEKYLNGIGSTFRDGVVDTEVLYGDPSERILYFAETREDPAIVMASHGRSGLQRVLLGSITARVVQSAVCPVFVVRGSESMDTDGGRTVDQIVIPLDGSQFAEQVLATVQSVFGPGGLKLILLRVAETQRRSSSVLR
jgi:nucleotide-binding universal stress UspA family protein